MTSLILNKVLNLKSLMPWWLGHHGGTVGGQTWSYCLSLCQFLYYEAMLIPLDGILVKPQVPPSILSGYPNSSPCSTHLYSWVERGSTVRVKCLAQQQQQWPRPALEPGPLHPESNALTIRPLHLHAIFILLLLYYKLNSPQNQHYLTACSKSWSPVWRTTAAFWRSYSNNPTGTHNGELALNCSMNCIMKKKVWHCFKNNVEFDHKTLTFSVNLF